MPLGHMTLDSQIIKNIIIKEQAGACSRSDGLEVLLPPDPKGLQGSCVLFEVGRADGAMCPAALPSVEQEGGHLQDP